MSDQDRKRPAGRKPWQKPEVRVIELAAEEVMAVGCKNVGTMTAYKGKPSCGIGVCRHRGS